MKVEHKKMPGIEAWLPDESEKGQPIFGIDRNVPVSFFDGPFPRRTWRDRLRSYWGNLKHIWWLMRKGWRE